MWKLKQHSKKLSIIALPQIEHKWSPVTLIFRVICVGIGCMNSFGGGKLSVERQTAIIRWHRNLSIMASILEYVNHQHIDYYLPRWRMYLILSIHVNCQRLCVDESPSDSSLIFYTT